jgi:S-DNA-T family DNA segregation ATPase FtsK/SpoIIIE
MPTEAGKPKRLQGSFVSDAEIERLVYFWGSQQQIKVSSVDFDDVPERPPGAPRTVGTPPDPMLEEAKRLAQEYKHISTSFLQRRLRIGYPRAARLMEDLQRAGVGQEPPPERES